MLIGPLNTLFQTLIIFFITLTSTFASEQLIIEPDAGREPLLSAIQQAHSSVDLVIYGFTDARFLNALIQAKRAGKNIQVLLERAPYKAETENQFAIKRLTNANIHLQYPNHDFKLTHQKTFLLDQRTAIIMTFNLTNSSFKNERNFALILDDPAIIKEISAIFTADWKHQYIPVHHPDLIWSPNNSREKILDFINNAKSDIKIYAQDISDYQIIGALAKASRSGKKVVIITSNKHAFKNKKMDYLIRAGVHIHYEKNYLIHAKVIIVDKKQAILGSINLTRPSLNQNRELSVVTRDPKVIAALLKTFSDDLNS